MNSRVGFMQGRLSPIVDGRIQAFPWDYWENEMLLAKEIGIQLMEWTIDSKELKSNPILLPDKQKLISKLTKMCSISVPSVTSDYFMENPPWISKSDEVSEVHRNIIVGMGTIGSTVLVIPLVDSSSIRNKENELNFCEFITSVENSLRENKIKIAIESDFEPVKLSKFISQFDPQIVGVNYDIGNSASLGYSTFEELNLYGERVINVHVKDRMLGGRTVPLGTGDADLPRTLQLLEEIGYEGNYILQTARAQDDRHAEAIINYANMVEGWLHV